ncbi:hypothetical protein TW80_14715 [Loktanella sp. S4079]|nr:hypothetical protein TW80_14715 [Loktanella sp. S4079]
MASLRWRNNGIGAAKSRLRAILTRWKQGICGAPCWGVGSRWLAIGVGQQFILPDIPDVRA